MTKLTIKITKDVLRESMYCSLGNNVGQNCAIGKAICSLFPNSSVGEEHLVFYSGPLLFNREFGFVENEELASTLLPESASSFINRFDKASPEQRLLLPEFSFDIEIPDEVVDTISIDEIKRIVQGSKTLELA